MGEAGPWSFGRISKVLPLLPEAAAAPAAAQESHFGLRKSRLVLAVASVRELLMMDCRDLLLDHLRLCILANMILLETEGSSAVTQRKSTKTHGANPRLGLQFGAVTKDQAPRKRLLPLEADPPLGKRSLGFSTAKQPLPPPPTVSGEGALLSSPGSSAKGLARSLAAAGLSPQIPS